jgi:2-phosphosulfolactate phosphatase
VIPVDTVEKCIRLGLQTQGITAGERDGKVIEGLQYGNSPAEYPESFIKGKTLVLTTTNGTKLLHMALNAGAESIVTGSFPNLSSVCNHLLKHKKNVLLCCSGWKDRFNLEDTLFAGAVVERIESEFYVECDSSLMAKEMYQSNKHNMPTFIKQLNHWKRLSQFGLEADLEFCTTVDVSNVLPIYKNGDLVVA